MKGAVWHEKSPNGKTFKPIPHAQHGHGSSDVDVEDDANFSLDEKTGLFLPAVAAKDRRKVKIGFQP